MNSYHHHSITYGPAYKVNEEYDSNTPLFSDLQTPRWAVCLGGSVCCLAASRQMVIRSSSGSRTMVRTFRSTPTTMTRTNWDTRTLSTREGPPCSMTRSQGATHPLVWPGWTSRTRAGTSVTPAPRISTRRPSSRWQWQVSSSSICIGCHRMNKDKGCIEQTLALLDSCFNSVPCCCSSCY